MFGRRIQGILIDFYGTISAGDREAVEIACRTIVDRYTVPASSEEFAVHWGRCFFQTIEQSNHEQFKTLLECEKASLSQALAQYGVSVPDTDLSALVGDLETYWENPPIYEDALAFLKGVSLPICCVSNADNVPLLSAISRHQLQFDAVISSEVVRAYKPDPAIFHAAAKQLGISTENLVHIGDSRHSDIEGAFGVGIATIWVHRESRILDVGSRKADYTVTSLDVLSDVIAEKSL
jgi:2-haloacid dehalogenase/putative hydrolase of the HAD superfamily